MRTDFYSLLPVTAVFRANGPSFTAASVEQILSCPIKEKRFHSWSSIDGFFYISFFLFPSFFSSFFFFCAPFYNKMETNRLIESESNVGDISKREGYLSLSPLFFSLLLPTTNFVNCRPNRLTALRYSNCFRCA